MKKITIYTTPSCTYCRQAKEFFKEKNISYEEHNVLTDVIKRQEMVDKSGQMGVPVIIVSDLDGAAEEIIIGFDRPHLTKLLNA